MSEGPAIYARKRAYEISGGDYYQTPPWATVELLKREEFPDRILEPAAGDGAISKVLEAMGHNVVSCELRTDEDVYGRKGVDFLADPRYRERAYGSVVMNPPFKYAQEFIERALWVSRHKVACLGKLAFLESDVRYRTLWTKTPLKTLYAFVDRLQLYPPKLMEKPANGGVQAYGWYVFEKGYEGEPTIRWIKRGG